MSANHTSDKVLVSTIRKGLQLNNKNNLTSGTVVQGQKKRQNKVSKSDLQWLSERPHTFFYFKILQTISYSPNWSPICENQQQHHHLQTYTHAQVPNIKIQLYRLKPKGQPSPFHPQIPRCSITQDYNSPRHIPWAIPNPTHPTHIQTTKFCLWNNQLNFIFLPLSQPWLRFFLPP